MEAAMILLFICMTVPFIVALMATGYNGCRKCGKLTDECSCDMFKGKRNDHHDESCDKWKR